MIALSQNAHSNCNGPCSPALLRVLFALQFWWIGCTLRAGPGALGSAFLLGRAPALSQARAALFPGGKRLLRAHDNMGSWAEQSERRRYDNRGDLGRLTGTCSARSLGRLREFELGLGRQLNLVGARVPGSILRRIHR
jgi:hypothetical protein